MALSFHLREQAERCRRLARDSTDPSLRDSLLRLADEYAARASAQENDGTNGDTNDGTAVWQAGSDDRGDA
jgi:hypothetical protein